MTGTGSIEKIGSGTWTLSGDSTHTSGTTVSGGTLNIDHNSLASNTALQINSGGTVNFDSVQNMTLSTLNGSGALIIADDGDLYLSSGGTFTGNISGDGGIVLNAGASLSLSGNNTFLAGIAIRNGALLVVDNASALGSESALLIFDGGALSATESTTIQQEFVALNTNGTGELNVDSGDEMTWAGPIEKWTEPFLTSTTTLIKSGAGTLAITRDANTFDGTVQVNAGQIAPSTNALAAATVDLQIQDAIRFDNAVTIAQLTGSQSLSLSNTLTLAGDADATFSGTLTGSGALFKEGTGTLTLDTDHSFTGNLLVNEGTLHLDGSLATTTLTCLNLALDNGTSLTGNANIAAPILSFGTAEISPGASIGTLQATRFQINGSYLCEIDGSQSDQLITTGELGLSVTSTLKLSFPSGGPTADAYVLASYGA